MFSWYEYFDKGGWLMWPILACSLIALAVALERWFALRRSLIFPRGLTDEVKVLVHQRKIEEAFDLCQGKWYPVVKLMEVALARHRLSREMIKEAVEHEGRKQAAGLERFIGVLATVAGVAPLLGLLGTVTGMIQVFNQISTSVMVNPAALAEGIYMALITTAAGLMVGIPSLVLHHYFSHRVDRLTEEMESFSMELIEMLTLEMVGPECE